MTKFILAFQISFRIANSSSGLAAVTRFPRPVRLSEIDLRQNALISQTDFTETALASSRMVPGPHMGYHWRADMQGYHLRHKYYKIHPHLKERQVELSAQSAFRKAPACGKRQFASSVGAIGKFSKISNLFIFGRSNFNI